MSCAACGATAVATFCFTEGLALCGPCDESAHGPDSLGADHERVAARHARAAADGSGGDAAEAPACDICKAADAVILCCDDRALMCRGCDRTVHAANEASKAHRRLLLSPVAVGFEGLAGGGGGAAATAAAAAAAAATFAKGKGPSRPAAPQAPRPDPAAAAAAAAAAHAAAEAAADARARARVAAEEDENEAGMMTMAAELLGLPPGSGAGFTAKDVDAAYLWEATGSLGGAGLGGLGGGGGGGGDDLDFEADLTALLGLGGPSDDPGGGGGPSAPAFEGAVPQGGLAAGASTSWAAAAVAAAPASATALPAAGEDAGGRSTRAGRRGRGASGGGGADGVVPEMGAVGAKRARG